MIWDNWLGPNLLSTSDNASGNFPVKNFLLEDTWNIELLKNQFPPHIVNQIQRKKLCLIPGSEDIMLWKLTSSGSFSLSSTVEVLRRVKNCNFVNKTIWSLKIPIKIGFFMTNLMLNKISLDCNVTKFGIHGPSACFCCDNRQEESVDHIFSSGNLAQSVWRYFEGPIGLINDGYILRKRCMSMWIYKGQNKFISTAISILPSLICWSLWKARNAQRYQGSKHSSFYIISEMSFDLLSFLSKNFPEMKNIKEESWPRLIQTLEAKHSRFRVKEVSWQFPTTSFKLNTDGSSRGNPGPAAGGGVSRDCTGSVIFAFSEFFGTRTSLQAEFMAMLLGISICNHLHIQNIIVESDSASMIDMLNKSTMIPRNLRILARWIDRLRSNILEFKHCLRQANAIADGLANTGQATQLFQLYSRQNLPSIIKSLIWQDSIGLSNLRFTRI